MKFSRIGRHERTFNSADDKQYSCSQCDYKSSTLSNLRVHEGIHTGTRPFSCTQCNYKCSSSSYLKEHEKIHTGDKPLRCSQCNYKCSRLNQLKEHERIHTGDKLFSCSQCEYKSSYLRKVKRHQKIHKHQNTNNDKPSICSHCDYEGPTPFSLELHARKYHNAKCWYKVCSNQTPLFIKSKTEVIKLISETYLYPRLHLLF